MEDRNDKLTKSKLVINVVLTIIFLALSLYLAFGTNILSNIKLSKEKNEAKVAPTVTIIPTPSQIIVDIQGAVTKPGVYKLNPESRVVDLITLAEGFSDDSDSGYIARNLNQASLLTDGMKLYIPFKDETDVLSSSNTVEPPQIVVVPTTASVSGKVSINTGTRAELIALPEIGEVTADKIIAARPFTSLDQVVAKGVMKQGSFDKVKHLLSL